MEISNLDRVFKAYDIRGLVDQEITPELTFAIGVAFANFLESEREPGTVVIGEDMRPSSPDLAGAFSDGITSQGLDVVRIGLSSTDQLYFASGSLNLPGAMFTASHNPAAYNGIKLCRSGARPIGQESGLNWIKKRVEGGAHIALRSVGVEKKRELLKDYVDYLLSLFPSEIFQRSYQGRQMIVAIDAGNGMGGHTAPAVFRRINAEMHGIYFELDGSFPNHEANPIDSRNLVDLQKLVKSKSADIGLAFDGDADRCFLIDEKAQLVSPSALTALIAERELKRSPASTIIYNLICSRAVPQVILENGGIPLRSRVGHSFIKQMMADHGAVFGGEHSGHFYFRDFWSADSGMLAALHAIAALYESNKSLSQLLEPYNRFQLSGEINTKVENVREAIARIRDYYGALGEPANFDELDGLTISSETWSFNVRPSNTEPLLRLNVEAETQAEMERIKVQVLGLINKQ